MNTKLPGKFVEFCWRVARCAGCIPLARWILLMEHDLYFPAVAGGVGRGTERL